MRRKSLGNLFLALDHGFTYNLTNGLAYKCDGYDKAEAEAEDLDSNVE